MFWHGSVFKTQQTQNKSSFDDDANVPKLVEASVT